MKIFNLSDLLLNNFEKVTDEFIQNYIFYLTVKANKPQLKELLSKYLKGENYIGGKGIYKKYPYNIPENQKFLRETFGYKKIYWLNRNEKTFEIEQISNNTQVRINHHLKVSNDKLQELGLENNFENHQSLVVFFDENIKPNESKFDSDIFSDLELQINQIKKLSVPIEGKNIKSVKIYHELNSFKILQMGNVVDGSCLAFVGSNSWSTVSNALEVNKGVFYFEDENGNIIGRVLLGVDKKGNFDMHPIYIKGNVTINLDKYFKIYIE